MIEPSFRIGGGFGARLDTAYVKLRQYIKDNHPSNTAAAVAEAAVQGLQKDWEWAFAHEADPVTGHRWIPSKRVKISGGKTLDVTGKLKGSLRIKVSGERTEDSLKITAVGFVDTNAMESARARKHIGRSMRGNRNTRPVWWYGWHLQHGRSQMPGGIYPARRFLGVSKTRTWSGIEKAIKRVGAKNTQLGIRTPWPANKYWSEGS